MPVLTLWSTCCQKLIVRRNFGICCSLHNKHYQSQNSKLLNLTDCKISKIALLVKTSSRTGRTWKQGQRNRVIFRGWWANLTEKLLETTPKNCVFEGHKLFVKEKCPLSLSVDSLWRPERPRFHGKMSKDLHQSSEIWKSPKDMFQWKVKVRLKEP